MAAEAKLSRTRNYNHNPVNFSLNPNQCHHLLIIVSLEYTKKLHFIGIAITVKISDLLQKSKTKKTSTPTHATFNTRIPSFFTTAAFPFNYLRCNSCDIATKALLSLFFRAAANPKAFFCAS